MELLPDEIQLRIFSYFSILERLTYERVCTKWRFLMPYRLTEIDLVHTFLSENRLKTADTFPLTYAVRTVLKRSGPWLKSVSFGQSNLLIPATLVTKIAETCAVVENLDLSFCTVTEQIVPVLMGLSDRLVSLNLANTTFTIWQTDQHVDNLRILFSNMTRLENISLQRTNAHNLLALSHLPDSLKSLNLNACSPLSPSALFELLVKCFDLEDVRLAAYSRVDNNIIQAICTLPRLRVLDISRQGASVSSGGGGDWRKLAQVFGLQELYAQYNDSITDFVLESVSLHCPNLRVLNVSYCRGISSFFWLYQLSHLSAFYAAANDTLTDQDVSILAQENGPGLRIFHAPSCTLLSGDTLRALAAFCPNLVELNVGQCETIGNDDVKVILLSCPKLEAVDIRCSQIDDQLFHDVLELSEDEGVLGQLRVLDISFCRHITDVGMQSLCQFLSRRWLKIRRGLVMIYVHQTRVSRAILENIECNVAKIQF